MKKIFLPITAVAAIIANTTHSENVVENQLESNILEECIKNNQSCNDRLPIDVGHLNVSPSLHQFSLNLGDNCGLRINYFIAKFEGHSKTQLPDGRILDFGKFESTIQQDYRYTIYTIRRGKDNDDCLVEGGWYPEDTTRQENIDKAIKMVRKPFG